MIRWFAPINCEYISPIVNPTYLLILLTQLSAGLNRYLDRYSCPYAQQTPS